MVDCDDTEMQPVLTVVMRNGRPVLSNQADDPIEQKSWVSGQIRKLEAEARTAPREDLGSRGWVLHKLRQHSQRLAVQRDDRARHRHKPLLPESVDGQICTACTCGVLVPGRIGTDITTAQFKAAVGHLPFEPSRTD